MSNFLGYAKDIDVLIWYSKVAPYLRTFLGTREIASKIIGEKFVVLKRGTKIKPLYIKDFDAVDDSFLKLRMGNHLDDVKSDLNEKQILLWQYFVPRKLVNFFYATNCEFGSQIDRIFIDIDRQDKSPQDAQAVASELIKAIQNDKKFSAILKFNILILRTGSSFHILLNLDKPVDHAFYDRYLSYGPNTPESFIIKRAKAVGEKTKLTVLAGHERKKGAIILDTSNTPPGKLARCPFSLHIKDAKTIDGICVPVDIKKMDDKALIPHLQSLTPETVWENIKTYDTLIKESLR